MSPPVGPRSRDLVPQESSFTHLRVRRPSPDLYTSPRTPVLGPGLTLPTRRLSLRPPCRDPILTLFTDRTSFRVTEPTPVSPRTRLGVGTLVRFQDHGLET